MRSLSKWLLGNKYRLEVVAAIADAQGEGVDALTLSDQTGIRYPRVQEELKHLEGAGLLKTSGSQGSRKEYKPVPSVYWELCSRLLAEAVASEAVVDQAAPDTGNGAD